MNLKNMRKLRAHLRSRKNPVGFDMRTWFHHNGRPYLDANTICHVVETHSCGTAACLAGHAAILARQSEGALALKTKDESTHIKYVAKEWLDLTYEQSDRLFHGSWKSLPFYINLKDLTKKQACTELTRLIDAEAALASALASALARAKALVT